MTGKSPILFLCGGLAAGGTERHLSHVLPALKQRGWPVSLVRLGIDGPMSAPIQAAGIEIFDAETKPWIPLPKLGGVSALLSQVQICRKILRDRKPEIVHGFLGTPNLIAAAATIFETRTKLVVSKRNQLKNPEMFRGERRGEKWAMRRADAVMVHSTEVLREVSAIGVSENRLHLVHNGIDPRPYDDARKNRCTLRNRFGWHGQTVLVQLANLIPYKGHSFLIETLARLANEKTLTADWRCVFVGKGEDPYEMALKELVAKNGLTDRIEFLGYRQDIPDILAAADLGLLLSDHEGFSNAILEYMSARLPVIATAVGGNLDSVTDKETGFLVAPGDQTALMSVLLKLLPEKPQRIAQGTVAASMVREKFSLSASIDGYENVYRTLMQS